jgi:hypothetical protein
MVIEKLIRALDNVKIVIRVQRVRRQALTDTKHQAAYDPSCLGSQYWINLSTIRFGQQEEGGMVARPVAYFQRRDWYRYSVGLAPHVSRNTRAKCCCVLKPHAMATSSTRISVKEFVNARHEACLAGPGEYALERLRCKSEFRAE